MFNSRRAAFWAGLLLGMGGGALITFTVMWWLGLASAWGVGPSRGAGAAATSIPAPGTVTRGANDIVIGLGESYLTTLVRNSLPPDAPLDRDLILLIDQGAQVVMESSVTVTVGPLSPTIPARVRIGIAPDAGQLGLTLEKVEVGPLPIPEQLLPQTLRGVLDDVEAALNRTLFDSEALAGQTVQSVRSDRGRLWLEFDDGR